jgi:hypothetical protein
MGHTIMGTPGTHWQAMRVFDFRRGDEQLPALAHASGNCAACDLQVWRVSLRGCRPPMRGFGPPSVVGNHYCAIPTTPPWQSRPGLPCHNISALAFGIRRVVGHGLTLRPDQRLGAARVHSRGAVRTGLCG